jgi:hypothetical protein
MENDSTFKMAKDGGKLNISISEQLTLQPDSLLDFSQISNTITIDGSVNNIDLAIGHLIFQKELLLYGNQVTVNGWIKDPITENPKDTFVIVQANYIEVSAYAQVDAGFVMFEALHTITVDDFSNITSTVPNECNANDKDHLFRCVDETFDQKTLSYLDVENSYHMQYSNRSKDADDLYQKIAE